MLHLLPIRLLILTAIVLTAMIVLALARVEMLFDGIAHVLRWAVPASLFLTLVPCIAWRWCPILQRISFPYLGGKWEGTIEFMGSNGPERRQVEVDVRHSLYRMKVILDSKESTSSTIALYVERNRSTDRHRIYYIYLNERKEGLTNAGQAYRGLAILAIVNTSIEMYGNYFTEKKSAGTLQLTRRSSHPWWTPLK